MSEILKDSLSYVEQAKVGLLITVGEGKVPYVRSIGAFSNEGSDIYFLTGKATEKVKHIASEPVVTFYFENEGQVYENFKSVAITGEASEVTESLEFEKAIESISKRYPKIKERVASGDIKNSSIYKVKAKFVKLADYTRTPRELIVSI